MDVSVHDANSEEQGLIGASIFKGNVEYFTHPVNHPSSEGSFKVVETEVIFLELAVLLKFSKVLLDLVAIVTY